ncbi:hypothetical protein IHE43_03110 [Flavobacterium sp. MDT1-60]|nr:hypothetical protein IHE43_03110 [Flavobacterium sp. MDT1-60]
MKTHICFILFLLMGCQKPKPALQIASKTTKAKIEAIAVKENSLRTDTIIFDKNAAITHVLIHLTEQKPDKDSIIESKFRLDFYKNKNKITSKKITIKGYEKGSEWSGSYGFPDSSQNNPSFIKIDFGYPACGYTFENYLYYLKNNDLQLVHQWQSMSDSGWGNWTKFLSLESKNDLEIFYCKSVSFEPADDDSEDSGILTYSDSISFSLIGNHWKKKLLSPKDKPYFEKKMSLNEFYKQD